VSTGYQLVLPHPWERIPLDKDMAGRVRELVDRSVARVPAEVPPDQVAPARHKIERELMTQLRAAQEQGGLDYYLPTDLMHGQQLNASFVVSAIVPDANADAALSSRAMASLLADAEARPISIAGQVWVRTERVIRKDGDDFASDEVALRRVQYRTAVPEDPRRWVIVTFTTVGDGNPDSDITGLIVELFDAIISTWQWRDLAADGAGDDRPAATP
jgi:hypothetical protein